MEDMDCDCDLGGCDCDFDCCCCDDCDCDLGACCCPGSSSDGQIFMICIDFHGQGKHDKDPGCWCCYCCCSDDTPKRRESTQIKMASEPEKMDKTRYEKRKKKDSESKNSSTSATRCSCHELNSQRMPKCPKCARPSSISPSLDPPMMQRFQWLDREHYAESKNSSTSATCCSCHELNSQRMRTCPKCAWSSSMSPSLDPPMTQQFRWLEREKYAAYRGEH